MQRKFKSVIAIAGTVIGIGIGVLGRDILEPYWPSERPPQIYTKDINGDGVPEIIYERGSILPSYVVSSTEKISFDYITPEGKRIPTTAFRMRENPEVYFFKFPFLNNHK